MKKKSISGLILIGGKSSRMNFYDKSLLNINSLPQREYLYNFLSLYFEDVFFSLTKKQSLDKFFVDKNIIVDSILEGPAWGIYLSLKDIKKALFVIACDMPYINEDKLKLLLDNFNNSFDAMCFKDEKGFLQPLFSIYNYSILKKLKKNLENGQKSLKKILLDSNLKIFESKNDKTFTNINTVLDLKNFKYKG